MNKTEEYLQQLEVKIAQNNTDINLLKKVTLLCLNLQNNKSEKNNEQQIANLEEELKKL